MHDVRYTRVQRELFLAAFGANVGATEPWVTDRLTALLEEQAVSAGRTLYSAGDPPAFYYFLRQGRVQLVREGSAPFTYEARSVFGLSDALLERPRVRTAITLTDVEAMRVHSEAWIELLEDSFSLARAAVVGSVRAVAELEQRLWAAGGALREPVAPACSPGMPLDVIERLAVLTEAPILHGVGVKILGDLAAASDVVTFRAGERLLERGRTDGRVMLLLDGTVEGRREAPDVLWRGGPGHLVCGTAVFGDPILAWTASATTAGRALTFPVQDWLDLMEEHFDMVRATLGALSLDRDELVERLQRS